MEFFCPFSFHLHKFPFTRFFLGNLKRVSRGEGYVVLGKWRRREGVIFSNFFSGFLNLNSFFTVSACDVTLLIKKCQNEVDPDEKLPTFEAVCQRLCHSLSFFALFGWYHLSTIDKFVPWCEKYSKIWRLFGGVLLYICLGYWCMY